MKQKVLREDSSGPFAERAPRAGRMLADANKAIVRRYYDKLWNEWDLSLADEILAEGIAFRGSLGVLVKGRSEFLSYLASVRRAFPDFRNAIDDLLAEGDKVVARMTYHGTHRGRLFNIAPTGKQVSYSGIAIFRIVDGKIVDGWVIADVPGLMKQLEERIH